MFTRISSFRPSQRKRKTHSLVINDQPYQVGDVQHNPYTSVRKIFYDYPLKSEQQQSVNGRLSRAASTPSLVSWKQRTSQTCKRTESTLEGGFKTKRLSGKRSSLYLSLRERVGSYADLYISPVEDNTQSKFKVESQLEQVSRLSQSEWKLNRRQRPKPRRRICSYDPTKFENLNIYSSNGLDINENNSCVITKFDEKEEDFLPFQYDRIQDEIIDSGSLPKGSTDSTPSSTATTSSSCDCPIDFIPWTKRDRNTRQKRKKHRHRYEKSKEKMSRCCDRLRSLSLDDLDEFDQSLKESGNKQQRDYNPDIYGGLYGDTYKQLHYLRSKSSMDRRKLGVLCDGYFGCC